MVYWAVCQTGKGKGRNTPKQPAATCFALLLLSLCTLGKNFSRRHFEIFLLFFLENRMWHFMQTLHDDFMQTVSKRDSLHDVSHPIFWKNNRNIISLSSAEFAHSTESDIDCGTHHHTTSCICMWPWPYHPHFYLIHLSLPSFGTYFYKFHWRH